MKTPWFNRTRFGFFPASIIGWIISVATALYCIYLFFEIDGESHSVSDTLIKWFINVAVINIFFSLMAFFTSRKSKS